MIDLKVGNIVKYCEDYVKQYTEAASTRWVFPTVDEVTKRITDPTSPGVVTCKILSFDVEFHALMSIKGKDDIWRAIFEVIDEGEKKGFVYFRLEEMNYLLEQNCMYIVDQKEESHEGVVQGYNGEWRWF